MPNKAVFFNVVLPAGPWPCSLTLVHRIARKEYPPESVKTDSQEVRGTEDLSPMNRPLSGYRAFLGASIQGCTISAIAETLRLAPTIGLSSLLITSSRLSVCLWASSSAFINA